MLKDRDVFVKKRLSVSGRYRYFIIDGQNFYWRSWLRNSKKFITHEGTKLFTGGIREAFDRINHVIYPNFGYESSECYFLFDNTFSAINIRKIITDGEYKHPRQHKKAPKQLYKTLALFKEILKIYSDNFYVAFAEGLEADDLTKPVLESLDVNKNNKALVISADLDWARNITDDCHWYDWNKVFDKDEFFKRYEFRPVGNSIKLYKAIHGDASDNIKNVIPRLPKELLIRIIQEFKDMDDLLSNIWYRDYPEQWKRKIMDASHDLRINYSLVDFVESERPLEDILVKCKKNRIQAKIWFETLGLGLETWMETKEDIEKNFFKKRKFSVQ